jgi:hypothetical protein
MGTTAGDDLNPKIVGLDKAMENLHARIGDTNEMVKLFGKRNYNAAAILADSTEQVKALTDAVTGTSEAHLQAEVNGKTLDAQLNRLSASWETLTAAIGESNGFLQSFVSWINQALQGIALFMRNSAEMRIGDHEKASNSRIKQRADDRLDHYLNDRDTKGNKRYNDKQARQQVINELRNERKYEYERAQALSRQIRELKTTKVSGWEDNVKKLGEELAKRNPASVKMVSLLFKPEALKMGSGPEYVGFEIPTKFILGYGLDIDGLARNLPDIYVLKEEK